jgi:predicted molibdopterin-dependent oxidoreductase YjgC
MLNAARDGDLTAFRILGEDVAQTDPTQQQVVASLS